MHATFIMDLVGLVSQKEEKKTYQSKDVCQTIFQTKSAPIPSEILASHVYSIAYDASNK